MTKSLKGFSRRGVLKGGLAGILATGVSPLMMARAYSTVNNGGSRVKPIAVTSVRFKDGKVDRKMGKITKFKVFTDGESYEGIQAMKGNVSGGTGTAAQVPNCTIAGKTGTTSEFKDAWFAGMSRQLSTAVWVGYPGSEGRVMNNVPGYGTMFGGDAPAEIFSDFMKQATKGTNCSDWPKPKVPFVSKSVSLKLSKSAPGGATGSYGDQSGSYAPGIQPGAQPETDDDANGTGTGNGGDGTGGGDTQFPPGQYEAPPQDTPAAPATPATPAPVTPPATDGGAVTP